MSNGINMGFLDGTSLIDSPPRPFGGSLPTYSNPIGVNLGNLPSMAPTGTINNVLAGGPAGTGSGVGGFLGGLGGFLDNLTSSDILQTGLSAAALQDQMSRLSGIGAGLAAGAREIGEEAQAASAFRPFTVSTGFGGVQATPEGGFATLHYLQSKLNNNVSYKLSQAPYWVVWAQVYQMYQVSKNRL